MPDSWEKELRGEITTVDQIKDYIRVPPEEEKKLVKIAERHPICVSKYYMSLIDPDNPNDPIKNMAIPSVDELNLEGSYDPSGENKNTILPGLQHKYPQTALIIATNRCVTYCRYCFRKRMVGLSKREVINRFETASEYVKEHPEITNVLITGGDPFALPTNVIEKFLVILSPIEHLDYIRFGTRTPVTLPSRIIDDGELLEIIEKYNREYKRIYIVTHFNHPNEITEKSIKAVTLIQKAGIVISNQTVLLKDVNDDPNILAELMHKLVQIGVVPYYLFQCRPVKRVKKHFQVPLFKGYEIVEKAKAMLDGHAKRFRFVMSHKKGKIEVIGVSGDKIYFKFLQARNPKNLGKLFSRTIAKDAGWLSDSAE